MKPRTIILASMNRGLIASILAEAGINPNAENVASSNQPGELIIRSPEAVAKSEVEANRALLLGLLNVRNHGGFQLTGTRIWLRWDKPEEAPGGCLDGSFYGTIVLYDHGVLTIFDHEERRIEISSRDISNATNVWTSLGKPEDAEPPRPDVNL